MQTGAGGVAQQSASSITGQYWVKLRKENYRAPGAPWLRQGTT